MNDQQDTAQSDNQNQQSQMPSQQNAGPIPTAPPGSTMPPNANQTAPTTDMGGSMGTSQGAGSMGAPTAAQPPKPEDTTPANFRLGQLFKEKLSIPIPSHNLNFDEEKFMKLLAGSISLSKEEKKRIIDTIPKLKQEQIDELIRIFEEEREKFAQLSKKHVPQLEKLAQQHFNDWMDLETSYKSDKKKEEDTAQADEIRKQLGI